MKKILLTKGEYALVNDEDYLSLSLYNWFLWEKNGYKYAARMTSRNAIGGRKLIKMHRQLMNAKSNELVDHEDNNGLNNQRSNLRVATRGQNNSNTKIRSNNTSGFKGVKGYPGGFRAEIQGKHIGCFKTAEEAARAYDKRAIVLFGKFARTNYDYAPQQV